ncbi:hypothetical protein [Nostoc sp. TCL26-01]|uniref:hypothetical protein n=1 Tax=Nostoc sp. TCL26-01 TaxID=2576904 RepID=UPI0015BB8481|nr:hypothetical protein [Nostoc sp. TCL26-01]QLE54125.1 hypothetical protein FD725_00425 [Nostoc sp. TCL26-01]
MKTTFLFVTRLLVATVASISFASLLTDQPSLAQLGTTDTPSGSFDENQNNLDFNSGNFNMFDLIHRANFGTGTFNLNQIDEAAKAYRDRLNQSNTNQQGGQVVPGLPGITNPSVTQPIVTPPSLILPPQN